nr:HD domain-containing protein [Marinifaba aquimaris]
MVETEKLKDVIRKTKPVGLSRYENSAEHSWHVCLSALMLKEYANEPVDILRVIKMLLIHDLGEIDAGDTIIYGSETQALKEEEAQGVKRVLALLPNAMDQDLIELWYEFEAGETADARFAKAIDRVPPLLHNLHGNGHSWSTHNVPKEQVFAVNQRIEKGSEALWSVIKAKLEGAVVDGLLK